MENRGQSVFQQEYEAKLTLPDRDIRIHIRHLLDAGSTNIWVASSYDSRQQQLTNDTVFGVSALTALRTVLLLLTRRVEEEQLEEELPVERS